MLPQRVGEAVGQAVVGDAAGLSPGDQPCAAQHPQAVAGLVLRHAESQCQVPDAQLLGDVECVEQASADRASATGAIVDGLFSATGTMLGGASQIARFRALNAAGAAAGNTSSFTTSFGGGGSYGGPMNTRGS